MLESITSLHNVIKTGTKCKQKYKYMLTTISILLINIVISPTKLLATLILKADMKMKFKKLE